MKFFQASLQLFRFNNNKVYNKRSFQSPVASPKDRIIETVAREGQNNKSYESTDRLQLIVL
jgi:hypothetical protein